jgi:hypothetical protein
MPETAQVKGKIRAAARHGVIHVDSTSFITAFITAVFVEVRFRLGSRGKFASGVFLRRPVEVVGSNYLESGSHVVSLFSHQRRSSQSQSLVQGLHHAL